MRIERHSGFTLIEIIVVIGILSIVGAVSSSILISSFRSFNKADAQNNLEEQGNYALSLINRRLKNARRVELAGTVCATNGRASAINTTTFSGTEESFAFIAVCGDGNGCIYYASDDHTAADGSAGTGYELTSYTSNEGVNVVFGGYCTDNENSWFALTENPPNPPTVTTQIYLKQSATLPEKQDYQVNTTLRTKVSLRNY